MKAAKMSQNTNTRIETDSFGALDVEASRYWGAQTQRSLGNFRADTPSGTGDKPCLAHPAFPCRAKTEPLGATTRK